VSILFLINNYPFVRYSFNQYSNDLGSRPYQKFIDYIKERGALSFWAHPEAEYILKMEGVGFITRKHPYRLLDTKGYTGFSIFWEGYNDIGRVGGIWDELLKDYCGGVREHPVWAIGGVAYDSLGDLSQSIEGLQTIILVSERSKETVLKSLAKGKAYVIKGEDSLDFSLDRFSVSDEFGGVQGFVGDAVKVKGDPSITVEGGFFKKEREVQIKIIKEGKVVQMYTLETPFKISYSDSTFSHNKTYYRLEIIGRGLHLVTNPIIVY
jgi:hypothetical protein